MKHRPCGAIRARRSCARKSAADKPRFEPKENSDVEQVAGRAGRYAGVGDVVCAGFGLCYRSPSSTSMLEVLNT